ncbi:MAG: CcdB family protein [Hyphomonas sp.]
MPALTVHTLKGAKQKVVVLQYPGLDTGASILVAPLFPASELPELDGVTPRVNMDGEDHLVAVQQLAAVQRKDLGPVVRTLADYEYPIANAINRLFFGI